MLKSVTTFVMAVATLYSLAAAFAYLWVFAQPPSTWADRLAIPVVVLAPYGVLYAAQRLARGPASCWIVCVAAVLCAALAESLYASSFVRPAGRGTYALVYFFGPAIQCVVALPALVAVVGWRAFVRWRKTGRARTSP